MLGGLKPERWAAWPECLHRTDSRLSLLECRPPQATGRRGEIQAKALAENEINIILSNHVSAERDAVALSSLNLDSYVTFGALNLKGEGIFSVATKMAPLNRCWIR